MATSTVSPTASSTTTSTATPSCYTAVPGKYGYVPPDACNAKWNYPPSFAAAVLFSTLFGFITVAQIGLAFLYRKGFCWVMIMGVGWEFASFVTRTLGAHNQQSLSYAFASLLLFLLAPLWINAFVYMTAGRMIWTFHPDKRIWRVKALSIGKYFVWLDIVSFLVQGIGGSMLSPGASANTMKIGKDVYMSGVGLQQFFILCFICLIIRFHIEVSRLEKAGAVNYSGTGRRWKLLTCALYAVLVLITIRICFRLAEFSAGITVSNPLPYHEVYQYVLDAVPMFLASTILTILHPGTVLKGPESEFPSRKERKAEKKAKKAAKKEAKMAKKKGLNTSFEPMRGSSSEPLTDESIELGYTSNGQHGEARYSTRHGQA